MEKHENVIHHAVKKERAQTLIMFGDAKLNLFSEDQVGTVRCVLFEKENKEGFFEGYTNNYLKVFVKTNQNLKNQIRDVFIREFKNNQLYGELIV